MANCDRILECVREEDYVEYFIFPEIQTNDEKEHELILNTTLKLIQKIVSQYTNIYLWHKDEFKLYPKTKVSHLLNSENENKGKLEFTVFADLV